MDSVSGLPLVAAPIEMLSGTSLMTWCVWSCLVWIGMTLLRIALAKERRGDHESKAVGRSFSSSLATQAITDVSLRAGIGDAFGTCLVFLFGKKTKERSGGCAAVSPHSTNAPDVHSASTQRIKRNLLSTFFWHHINILMGSGASKKRQKSSFSS